MKSVLVVDDDDSYVYLLRRKIQLLQKDVTIHSCASGMEALEFLENVSRSEDLPSVIILDLNMPVMNGFEFLDCYTTYCQNYEPDVALPPVWVVTSSNRSSDRDRAQEFSVAKGFLVKPVNSGELAEILNESNNV